MKSQDFSELIKLLESVPDSYIQATLPCPTDDRIREVVSWTMNASPDQRRAIHQAITAGANGTLRVFAERMATLSVRKQSPDLLLSGLVAMTMVNINLLDDPRLVNIRLSLLHHSAHKLGLDVEAFFEQAAHYMRGISMMAGTTLSFLDRTAKNRRIEAMGYQEIEGPSGLIYGGGSLTGIPAGLLFEDEPLIPDDVEAFFTGLGDPLDTTAMLALYFDINQHGDPASRFEGKLLDLLHSGSHDPRVVLALGGLRARAAVDKLSEHLSADTGGFLGHFRIDVAVALWWIEPLPQALQTIIDSLLQESDWNLKTSAAIALRYFECTEAVKALKLTLESDRFDEQYYALKSLIALGSIFGEVDEKALLVKMRAPGPEARRAFLAEVDRMIARFDFPGCL